MIFERGGYVSWAGWLKEDSGSVAISILELSIQNNLSTTPILFSNTPSREQPPLPSSSWFRNPFRQVLEKPQLSFLLIYLIQAYMFFVIDINWWWVVKL